MKITEWVQVFYNGLETNIEVTKCGRVRKIRKEWEKRKTKIQEIDFSKLKLNNRYKQVGIKIKGLNPIQCQVHQLIAASFLQYKFNGHDFVVDHIDSNTLNNNLNNLRVITQRENNSKERTIKSGLPTGVSFSRHAKKYKSQIVINSKTKHLGYFNTPEEASQAYQNKLKEISIHKNN